MASRKTLLELAREKLGVGSGYKPTTRRAIKQQQKEPRKKLLTDFSKKQASPLGQKFIKFSQDLQARPVLGAPGRLVMGVGGTAAQVIGQPKQTFQAGIQTAKNIKTKTLDPFLRSTSAIPADTYSRVAANKLQQTEVNRANFFQQQALKFQQAGQTDKANRFFQAAQNIRQQSAQTAKQRVLDEGLAPTETVDFMGLKGQFSPRALEAVRGTAGMANLAAFGLDPKTALRTMGVGGALNVGITSVLGDKPATREDLLKGIENASQWAGLVNLSNPVIAKVVSKLGVIKSPAARQLAARTISGFANILEDIGIDALYFEDRQMADNFNSFLTAFIMQSGKVEGKAENKFKTTLEKKYKLDPEKVDIVYKEATKAKSRLKNDIQYKPGDVLAPSRIKQEVKYVRTPTGDTVSFVGPKSMKARFGIDGKVEAVFNRAELQKQGFEPTLSKTGEASLLKRRTKGGSIDSTAKFGTIPGKAERQMGFIDPTAKLGVPDKAEFRTEAEAKELMAKQLPGGAEKYAKGVETDYNVFKEMVQKKPDNFLIGSLLDKYKDTDPRFQEYFNKIERQRGFIDPTAKFGVPDKAEDFETEMTRINKKVLDELGIKDVKDIPMSKQQIAQTGLSGKQAQVNQAEVKRIRKKSLQLLQSKASKDPKFARALNKILPQDFKDDMKSLDREVDHKVNLLDHFRTPDRVLKKIGLEAEGNYLRQQYDKYLDELPKEINKVNKWYEQVKSIPNAEQRIFRFLDGQKTDINGKKLELTKPEMDVAIKIRSYLGNWADKLNLPKEARVTNYITHIFEKDFIQKEFDPELARLITDKIPGSVYDPFTQKRLGKQGYVEDVFRALDAYIKRGVRKVNMDPALAKLQAAENKLDPESFKYVQRLAADINLRPTEMDNIVDNMIKQSPVGYKLGQRPIAYTSRKVRQSVYRGALGLNVGSAVKNLTQGTNTYAKLGEKYTVTGYAKAIREIANGGKELEEVGVLRDSFIQDRNISVKKQALEKLDKKLWVFFDFAEKINRGAAYFGAKARALNSGKTEAEAIKAGIDMARDTQFTFGKVDTPLALRSDTAKLFTQFQSFNIKQAEFLTEMIKNKEVAGMIRWAGANALIVATVGKVIGYDWEDTIPFLGALKGETKLGETPAIQMAKGIGKAIFKAPDKYGTVPEGNLLQRLGESEDIRRPLPTFFPAGVQIKKTYEGLKAAQQGASTSKTGRVRYPVKSDLGTKVRMGIFGQYSVPEAREYFNEKRTPLSEKQTKVFLSLPEDQRQEYYDTVLQARAASKAESTRKETIKTQAQEIVNKASAMGERERARYLQGLERDGTMNEEMAKEIKKINTARVKEGKSPFGAMVELFPSNKLKAQFIVDKLKTMSPGERNKVLQQMEQDGTMTKDLAKEIKKINQGK